MRMKLVTINGPLGVGKTWCATRVAALLPNTAVTYISWQDPLRRAAMAMLGADSAHVPYDVFKATDYFGKTGREWMILLSEEFLKKHGTDIFFSAVMHQAMRTQLLPVGRKHIFIADSNGFEHEVDYFRVQTDLDLLTCSIEPEGSPARGELWHPGDSRFNLAHKCSLVHTDSTTMAHAIVAALERRGWV